MITTEKPRVRLRYSRSGADIAPILGAAHRAPTEPRPPRGGRGRTYPRYLLAVKSRASSGGAPHVVEPKLK